MSLAHRGKPSHWKGKKKPYMTGNKHWFWKGNRVGYKCLHDWVNLHKGRPLKCANPNCVYPRLNERNKLMLKPTRIEWASKSHKATRDLSDYISLCSSCHRFYDYRGVLPKFNEDEQETNSTPLPVESEEQDPEE